MSSLADQLAAAIDVETTDSIEIGGSADFDDDSLAIEQGSCQRFDFPPISPVDFHVYSQLLHEPNEISPITETVPKVIRNTTLFEKWRSQTENQRKLKELKAEHEKEMGLRRKRELELANQLKQLEIEKQEEKDIQRAREADLKAQLQQRERDQALIEERKHQDLTAVQDELQRLREVEQRYLKQISHRRQEKQVSGHAGVFESVPARMPPGYHQKPALLNNQRPSSADIRPVAAVGNAPAPLRTIIPPVSVPNFIPNNLHKASINTSPSYSYHFFNESCSPSPSTPVGGRSLDNVIESPPVLPPQHATDLPSQCFAQSPFVMNAPRPSSRFQPAELGPSSQQLAARQVISKDLPTFSGDPSDWPLFYSSYQHSTQVCGYSDSENLLRLQRSLKGRAREAVSSFLLHPSTVHQVVTTLQTLFGRPEHIIHNMISKVRAIPAPRADKLETLVDFGLAVQNLCGHHKAIGLEQHLSNPMLLQELVDKLPANVKLSWALHQDQVPEANLSDFGEYMGKIVSATSNVTFFNAFPQKSSKDIRSNEKAYVNAHTATNEDDIEFDENGPIASINSVKSFDNQTTNSKVCPACGAANHQAIGCSSFKRLSVDDRWNVVKGNKLCRRCPTQHIRWLCKGEVCGINGCQKKHHRLLHSNNSPAEAQSTQNPTNATVTVHRHNSSSTLFRVLPVTLYGKNGQVNTLAFLDDGSSVTLVEQSLVSGLGVDGPAESLCIQWTGGVKKQIADTNRVQLQISAVGSSKRFKLSEVYTVEDLGLPEQSLDFSEMSARFKHLEGLPVQSFDTAVPGVLIGLNNTHLLSTLKLREGQPDEPIATKTRIGWSIYGCQRGKADVMPHRQLHICTKSVNVDLHDYVQSFFSIENLGVAVVPQVEGADEKRARKILQETTVRTNSGRFQTGLLWKHDGLEFPDSRPLAEKRLRCLERRLSKDPETYNNVRQQILDYQEKGYAHQATIEELRSFDPRRTWYLPLGVVLHPRKPGKVRIIWDAAAKVEGVSLNSMLLKGPDLLTSLLSVLFQYREREVAISGDIKEMFHQLLIREEDRCALLFLWRNFSDMPIEVMVMNVAIFGASCSPAKSIFAMNLNATENEVTHPKAAAAITRRHYVDDYLDSVDTEEEAAKLVLEVAEVHSKAGFEIRNWMSNRRSVLEKIGEVNPRSVKCFTADKETGTERLLGMIWVPDEDVFSFSLSFRDDLQQLVSGEIIPTKREMLKVTMSIYDPLGIVAAFVIHGKVLVQDVWRFKIDWDEKVSSEIYCRWKQWLTVLRNMNAVKVPRCYFPGYNTDCYDSLELHIFVDASEEAYAAVAYFRVVDNGLVRCSLVSSKTKVAPLQPFSIPRLELLAAVIGARLRKTIEEKHSLKIQRTVLWSDSSTVIAWIKSDVRRYRQFVAFRINEILSLSSVNEWRWVPTKLNVADEATKWGKGPSSNPDSRWYRGPEFLYDNEQEWPKDCRDEINTTAEELRPAFVYQHHIIEPPVKLERFSRWERLLRSMAYVARFIDNRMWLHRRNPLQLGDLTSEELQKAERCLWRIAQCDGFPDEVAILKNNLQPDSTHHRKLERNSPLFKLTPAMDEFYVLRIDGRIPEADFVDYDARNPIILPKRHRVTYLLLDWYHRRFQHANDETIVNEVRQRFYISELRVQVRLVRKQCMWCQVYKAVPAEPRMGPLPKARLTPFHRPFTMVGIDYFGPYTIRSPSGRSPLKRWVVLFTCLTIRAIHLEIAANLSTESCKKAIRRFIGRRGAPLEIHSDNGTNFVGTSRELAAEIRTINQEISSTFTDIQTQWRFNPPLAPHMGGCWERMVRSVKVALEALPTVHTLDEESFATVLVEAESMINSRPLTFVPLETAEHESLTPNHFLLLSSSGVRQPIKEPVEGKAAIRNSWNLIQNTLDGFWRRWVSEYLPTITRRTKWFENIKPIREGELVILVDGNVRNRWLRGRVVQTYPGRDGTIRRADVQTSCGILRRPVVKLAVLDVDAECDAEATVLATRGGEC